MAESDAYYRALNLVPTFLKPTGDFNILDFIHRVEQIGKNLALSDEEKVDIVNLRTGSSIKDIIDTRSESTTWPKLKKELITFFAPFTNPRQLAANFASVHQMPNEPIRDYAIRIKTIASYLKRANIGNPNEKIANQLLEEQLLQYFIEGLVGGGQLIKAARNFDEALEMALKYENPRAEYFSAFARPDFNIEMGQKGTVKSEENLEMGNQQLKAQVEQLQASMQALTLDFKKERDNYRNNHVRGRPGNFGGNYRKNQNYGNRDFYRYEARNNRYGERRFSREGSPRAQAKSYPRYRNNFGYRREDTQGYNRGRYSDRQADRRSQSPFRQRSASPRRNFDNQKN